MLVVKHQSYRDAKLQASLQTQLVAKKPLMKLRNPPVAQSHSSRFQHIQTETV